MEFDTSLHVLLLHVTSLHVSHSEENPAEISTIFQQIQTCSYKSPILQADVAFHFGKCFLPTAIHHILSSLLTHPENV